jgi:hypothetical protein
VLREGKQPVQLLPQIVHMQAPAPQQIAQLIQHSINQSIRCNAGHFAKLSLIHMPLEHLPLCASQSLTKLRKHNDCALEMCDAGLLGPAHLTSVGRAWARAGS